MKTLYSRNTTNCFVFHSGRGLRKQPLVPSRVKHFKVVRLEYNADAATKCLVLHPEPLSYRKELSHGSYHVAPTKPRIQDS